MIMMFSLATVLRLLAVPQKWGFYLTLDIISLNFLQLILYTVVSLLFGLVYFIN